MPERAPAGHRRIEPRSFSFNNPFGACPACTGIGSKLEVDVDLVVPDPDRSLADGAIAPWSLGKATQEYWTRLLEGLSHELGFSMDEPWKNLPKKVRDAVLLGKDFKVVVQYRNRFGRERKYSTGFEGAFQYIHRKHEETESEMARDRYKEYMREVPCPECNGARLNPASLSVLINGKSIADVSALPLREASSFLDGLELTAREAQIGHQVLIEIQARLRFLLDVGLEYLNLERAAGTLSGGEAQRIRLATQIGSGLVGVLYVLDEPSIGLHQRDNRRLIETLTRLRDLGNTLIVVEHDEDTIAEADWIVDIGPGAGEHGGEVVHSGSLQELLENTRSITGDYLSGRRRIELPAKRRKVDKKRQLKVVGARENNLRGIDAQSSRWASSPRSPASAAPASRPWSTTSSTRCWRTSSTGPSTWPAGTPGWKDWTSWTRWSTWTKARSGAPHGPIRPPTRACSTTSASCLPRPTRPSSAVTCPAGSPST